MSRDARTDEAPAGGGVRLGDVAREVPGATLHGDPGVVITGVHHDSRRVETGDLFVARAGGRAHGAAFLADAIAAGARAVLVERRRPDAPGGVPSSGLPLGVPRIEVDDVPRALAYAAAAVYGHPTFALEVIGITGTNGKTTTSHLVQACVDACGGRAGIVGTLGYRFEALELEASHTSPEADELARIAREMLARGATHLVMEVSSIALAACRADAVRFRCAAFTNLTQDHLDYHGSMDAYAEAKAKLFTELSPGAAVVNADDAFGRELARRVGPGSDAPAPALLRYSATPGADVEVAPVSLAHEPTGIAMTVQTPRGDVEVRSPLLGAHNVSNLLCAIAVAVAIDLDPANAAAALSRPITVAGRLERCDDPARDDIRVLVDYAHTPDALARVLASVRPLTRGRVVCVFGCGGDRDPGKRPLMGEAVARGADVAFVTNDNPRSEDPRAIADAILPGLAKGGASWRVELDRAIAIERAVLEAEPGDVVLVAGKGHEPYQIVGATTLSFDDRDHTRDALGKRRAARGAA